MIILLFCCIFCSFPRFVSSQNYDYQINFVAFGPNPYVHVSADGKFIGGIDVHIMRLLASSMRFRLSVNLTQWSYFDPATREWTGMVGQIIRGAADVGIGQIQYPHITQVDFSTPIYPITYMYMPTKPKTVDTLGNIFYPLGKWVWICFVVSLFIVVLVLTLIFKKDLFEAIWSVYTIAISQTTGNLNYLH